MLKCTKHSKSYTNILSYKTFEVIYIVLGACKHRKVTIIRKITKKNDWFLGIRWLHSQIQIAI